MRALVIIPTYKEAENIEKIINAVIDLSYKIDILIVDDNSPDKTTEIVEKIQEQHASQLFLIKRAGKLGLGTAYICGFTWALERGYDYIIEMDADFSHNPADLIRMIDVFKNEPVDVIVGSRYVTGGKIIGWTFKRKLYSFGGSLYARILTFLPVKDATGGFTAYTAEVLKNIELNSIEQVGYGFQIEMKFIAWKKGFKIKEIPIVFVDRVLGESKMSTKILKEAACSVLKLSINSLLGKYKKNNT
ncbi:MAG: polyprenol monophosphomannose synthase [Sediminibacterium sp.]|nr:polyprenol monophosphomannose synthase [Sediminibacterium sp.]